MEFERTLAERFWAAIQAHDNEGLAGLLAPGVRMRAITPPEYVFLEGRGPVAEKINGWFSRWRLEPELQECSAVQDKPVMTYRFRAANGDDRRVVEQHAYFTAGADGFEHLDILCSGFRLVSEQSEGVTRIFDAGDLGCGDGLAGAFRSELSQVPVGGRLEVTTSDPAAREDLPPLARMLGNTVLDVRADEAGRTIILVEKNR